MSSTSSSRVNAMGSGSPSGYTRVYGGRESYSRTGSTTVDFRSEMSASLSADQDAQIRRTSRPELLAGYPVEETDKITHATDRIVNDAVWMGIVPDRSVPHLVTARREESSTVLVRRGLMSVVDTRSLATPAGAAQFQRMIQVMSNAAIVVMATNVIQSMMHHGSRATTFRSKHDKGDALATEIEMLSSMGIMQVDPSAFALAFRMAAAAIRDIMTGDDARLHAFVPPSILLRMDPAVSKVGAEAIISITSELERVSNIKIGRTASPSGEVDKVSIWPVRSMRRPAFAPGSPEQTVNVLERDHHISEYYRGMAFGPASTYRSSERNLTLYSSTMQDDLGTRSFLDILQHSRVMSEPEPEDATFPLTEDLITGNTPSKRRGAPWCYAIDNDGDRRRIVRIKALGQGSLNVFSHAEIMYVVETKMHRINRSIEGENMEDMVALLHSVVDRISSVKITKKYVERLVADNRELNFTGGVFDGERMSSVADDIAEVGFADLVQWATTENGTMVVPRRAAAAGDLKDMNAPAGFANPAGITAISKMDRSNTGGWPLDLIENCKKLVKYWSRFEMIVRGCNHGNYWLDVGLRASNSPRVVPGMMAMQFFSRPLLPAWVQTGGATSDAVVQPDAYISFGFSELGNEKVASPTTGQVRTLLNAVNKDNTDEKVNSSAGSAFYGAHKFVLVDAGTGQTAMPADVAYAAIAASPAFVAGRKLKSLFYVTQLQAILGTAGVEADALIDALIGVSDANARGIVKRIAAAADKLAESTAVLAEVANGKLVVTGAKLTGGAATLVQASPAAFASDEVAADFERWLSGSEAAKAVSTTDAPFPFVPYTNGSDAGKKAYDAVIGGTGRSTILRSAFSSSSVRTVTALKRALSAEGADKANRDSAQAVVGTVTGTVAGGTWVRTPLGLSYQQCRALVGQDIGMLPSDPSGSHTTVYRGNDKLVFEEVEGLRHDFAVCSHKVHHFAQHVSAKQPRTAHVQDYVDDVGDRAAQIGGDMGHHAAHHAAVGTAVRGNAAQNLLALTSSTNFCRRVSALTTTADAMTGLYILTLGDRYHTMRDLEDAISMDVHVPLGVIVARPCIVARTASMVLAAPGSGRTLVCDANVSAGGDVASKSTAASSTLYTAAITDHPEHVFPVASSVITQYVSGDGIEWMTQQGQTRVGDLVACVVPHMEMESLPAHLSLSGSYSFATSSRDAVGPHFSAGGIFNEFHHFGASYASHGDKMWPESASTQCEVTIRGTSYSHVGSSVHTDEGKICRARIEGSYPGARGVITGAKNFFDRTKFENTIARPGFRLPQPIV